MCLPGIDYKIHTVDSAKGKKRKLNTTADAIAMAIGIKVFASQGTAFSNEHDLYYYAKEVAEKLKKEEKFDCDKKATIYVGDKTTIDCHDFMEWDDDEKVKK